MSNENVNKNIKESSRKVKNSEKVAEVIKKMEKIVKYY